MNILEDSRYILFSEKRVFCRPQQSWRLLSGREVLAGGWQVMRMLPLVPGDPSIQALEVAGPSEQGSWLGLRELLTHLDENEFRLLGTATQVLEWATNHRFCGRCGEATEMSMHERAMRCSGCGLTQYPRVSPCIIALVTRGDEILLARSRRATLPVYSCLAGFVEAGESAEDAVHREILEEVSVRVRNLRYQRSQPWPFPHQLMLGYIVDYESGDIQIEEAELADARWWPITELPQIPPPQTIAGQLIQAYIQERV